MISKKQIERSCLLIAVRKQLVDFLKPPTKAKKKKGDEDFISVFSLFHGWETNCKPFPDDIKKKAARYAISLIDAELKSYNVKAE